MLNSNYINSHNKEKAGTYFIQKSLKAIISKNYSLGYEYLIEGLNTITCDCVVNQILKVSNHKSIQFYHKSTFGNEFVKDYGSQLELDVIERYKTEYQFCKAFVYSFSEDAETIDLGIEAIDSFLASRNSSLRKYTDQNEYGKFIKPHDAFELCADQAFALYIKGRLFSQKKEYTKSIEFFNEAKDISSATSILYRIGRIKEEYLHLDGLDDLYSAFINNVGSTCCCRILSKYGSRRGLKIEMDETLVSQISQSGNTYGLKDYKEFIWYFNKGVENEIKYRYPLFLNSSGLLHDVEQNNKFLAAILASIKEQWSWIFYDRHPKEEIIEETSNELSHTVSPKEDDDSIQHYEKYGGYNDWSDEIIDDVFDGDPENTWNVD